MVELLYHTERRSPTDKNAHSQERVLTVVVRKSLISLNDYRFATITHGTTDNVVLTVAQ